MTKFAQIQIVADEAMPRDEIAVCQPRRSRLERTESGYRLIWVLDVIHRVKVPAEPLDA